MKILVDTSVWSLALRRKSVRPIPASVRALTDLVADGRVAMLGVVRQELLSGIRAQEDFELLRDRLRAFADEEVSTEDFEQAAGFFNLCRSHGVQGSNTDFLICAVAARRRYPILSTDHDFERYARWVPIVLHATPSREGAGGPRAVRVQVSG